jgi:hypothetical protein
MVKNAPVLFDEKISCERLEVESDLAIAEVSRCDLA